MTRMRTMIPAMVAALVVAACGDGSPVGPGETPMPVASVVVEPDTVTLTVGQSHVLRAKAYGADGSTLQGRAGSWASNDTTVFSVDAQGRGNARAAGVAEVTATVEGKAGRATVRVQAPVVPVASVRIGPDTTMTLAPGATAQLEARVYAADGTELTGRTVTWSSSRTDFATVSGAGLVVGIADGIASITATSEGKSAQARVTVASPVPGPAVASVVVRPSLVVTYAGVEAPLVATLRADDGTVLEGRAITWSSSDETVARVDAAGVVRGLQGGEAVITASVEGKSATVAAVFNTTSSYHLAYDREDAALVWMDMRTGLTTKMLEHGAPIRSTDPSPSPTRNGFAYVIDSGAGTTPQVAIQSWGGATYQFLTGGDQPAWSPDGARVAFRSTRSGRADIWWIRADGATSAINLTADLPQGVESARPAWSPTGDRIVFAASNARGGSDLWIMNADGSGKRQLTSTPFLDTEPTWFGDRIVFTRRTLYGTSDLFWMYVNGALVQQLTAFGGAQAPAWSPDGRWIAFVVRDGEGGIGDLYVARPDGTDVRPLSLRSDGPDGGGSNPAWTLHW